MMECAPKSGSRSPQKRPCLFFKLTKFYRNNHLSCRYVDPKTHSLIRFFVSFLISSSLFSSIRCLVLFFVMKKHFSDSHEHRSLFPSCYPSYSSSCGENPELEFLNSLWGARNRGGIGLSFRASRLHRLAEFIPWNRFPGPINV
jgi:hypothetical protein